MTKGFSARLAKRPILVFDFRALWRSTLSLAINPERQNARKSKPKMVSQPLNPRINVAICETVSYSWLINVVTALHSCESKWEEMIDEGIGESEIEELVPEIEELRSETFVVCTKCDDD